MVKSWLKYFDYNLTMKIDCKIIEDRELEVRRILASLKPLNNNFYFENGFHPVTKIFPKSTSTVIFPEMTKKEYDLLEKPSYEELILTKLKKFDNSVKLMKKIVERDRNSISMENNEKIKLEWEKVSDRFFDYLQDFYELPYHNLNISVILTSYGTSTSFLRDQKNKNNIDLYIWVRDDMGIDSIAEGIISGLNYFDLDNEGMSWNEQEAVYDYLLKFTKLKRLFSNHDKGTLSALRDLNISSEIIKSSQEFLNKIGYKHTQRIMCVGNDIYIDGNRPLHYFTPTESRILDLLIQNKQKPCSYFDIAKVVWEDPEDFSLWAISRMIYKIRNKLDLNGIPADSLVTYRKKGFLLEI